MSTEDAARRARWPEVERLYWLAIEREGDARRALLDEACGTDVMLRREVESLLAADAEANGAGFLEGSGIAAAADLLGAHEGAGLIGRQIGPYVVQSWIGSGGMGDVYRATDTNLRRDVALKILSTPLAAGAAPRARVEHEAHVLASLNHQHIAAIYGFAEADDVPNVPGIPGVQSVQALVLELVDGATLADLLASRRMPVDDTLSIARQIAEGLEAAHGRGIVHCDLKPSNIAVRPDGVVKLLDFGIAAVMHQDASSDAASGALGTAAYASPELLRGRPTDRRTDIWSFGAVLYEMLAGRPAFTGTTIAETISAVLNSDVDYTALPGETPAAIRDLIARCLTRDPRQRLQDIGEARIALERAGTQPSTAPVPVSGSEASWRRMWPFVFATIAAATIASAATWWWLDASRGDRLARLTVMLPEGQVLSLANGRRAIAISPDGRQIVYAGVPSALYRRDLSDSTPVAIKGSEGLGRVSEPTFSPDGRSVAFHADGAIRIVPIAGGASTTVARADAPFGMTWGDDGLVFARQGHGIVRVPASGGTPETIVRLGAGEDAYGPQVLPGGHTVLFTLAPDAAGDRWDRARIVLQLLDTGARTTLMEGGSDARYLPSGHLLYARRGTLYAVKFDLRRGAIAGTPRPVLEKVNHSAGGQTRAVQASASKSGSLVYVPAPAASDAGQGEINRLGFIDRRGDVTVLAVPADSYETPRLSPDGRRIAFVTTPGAESIVWIWDLTNSAPRRRLTFTGNNRFPLWSPDGTHVVFQSDRDGDRALFVQSADGAGMAERLTTASPGIAHVPQSWSPDGRILLFTATDASGMTLWTLTVSDRHATRFPNIPPAATLSAAFSPDGRWVAYAAGDHGVQRLRVQPFVPTGAIHELAPGSYQPSHPVWSPDGREIVFNPGLRNLGIVPVQHASAFTFGVPAMVPRAFRLSPPDQERAYDIAADGRFLARVPIDDSLDATRAGTRIEVVLDWLAELPR